MGIINRIKSIFKANVNASLDKMEDPEKMVDQYLRDAEEALGTVKAKAADAAVIAEKAKKKVAGHKALIEEVEAYATAALNAGNEEDIEKFITKKVYLEEQLATYEAAQVVADTNLTEVRRMHDELQATFEDYKNKREIIRSKADVLKIKVQLVGVATLSDKTNTAFGNFARLEERLDEQLVRMNAIEELTKPTDVLADAKAKYDIQAKDTKISDAIAAFKAGKGICATPAKA